MGGYNNLKVSLEIRVLALQKTAAEVILVDGDKTEMTQLPKRDRVAGCTPCREVGSTMEGLRLLLLSLLGVR